MKLFLLHIIVLFSLFQNYVQAQYLEIAKPITSNNGLSENYVYEMFQDDKGYLWFCTKDGLNRFDGYNFRIYKSDYLNKPALRSNNMYCIIEDKEDNLWIGTSRGISLFSLSEDRFISNKLTEEILTALNNSVVSDLFMDENNNVWIGTSKGVFKYLIEENKLIQFSAEADCLSELKNKYIRNIFQDSSGIIWFGTFHNGLYSYNQTTHTLSSHEIPQISKGNISSILEVSNELILIGYYSKGICLYNKMKDQWEWLQGEKYLYDEYVNKILKYSNNIYLVASKNGVYEFNLTKKEFKLIWKSKDNLIIDDIFIDKSGVLWINANGKGIYRLNIKSKKFHTVKQQSLHLSGLSFSSVRAIIIDNKNRLWVGGHGGINIFDYSKADYSLWKTDELLFTGAYNVYSLAQDPAKENIYWIGTAGRMGLMKYNYKTKAIKPAEDLIKQDSIIVPYEIRSILTTSKNMLYFATDKNIISYNPVTEKFSEYVHNKNNPGSIVNPKYYSLYEDKIGRIWIGSCYDGVSVLDPGSKRIINFRSNDSEKSLSSNSIHCLCEDRNGNMWIGTENGLNKYLPSENEFKVYSTKDGFANSFIYGILKDNEGRFWLSTNKGIIRFNPQTEEVVNFDVSQGLQSNEFNSFAYYHNSNGEMFFGGINGITSFFPDKIKLNDFQPDVLISSFKINNEEVTPAKKIYYDNTVELNYEDHYFSFEFSSNDYTNSSANKFRYIMEGFSERWINTDASNRIASFTNIDPGDYKLRIQSTNSDGLWSEHEAQINIIVHPAYWQTWWFKLLIYSIILGVIFSLFRQRIIRLKQNREFQQKITEKIIEKQEEERERIAGELHDSIGQDLLIAKNKLLLDSVNTSNKILNEEVSEILSGAIDGVSRISHNLSPLELEELGFTETVSVMISRISESSNINFDYKAEDVDEYIDDKNRIALFRILQEALNNIIKHSQAQSASLSMSKSDDELIITIKDDGIGFDVNALGTDLERPHFGLTGIKERVKLLNGNLKISSEKNKGTKLELRIPNHSLKKA